MVEPGQTLLHFRFVEQIGAGAMGNVWRATDTTLDRDVALKVLPAALAADPSLRARFEREAKLLASLNHASVAAVYGVHSADDTHFLSMELVPGEDLSDRLKRGPLAIDEAIPILRRIADATEAAHDSGVIHRDLKPANVRLTPDGRVKVLDFGLAKSFRTAEATYEGSDPPADLAETTAGVILGTAPYMSPEQARGAAVDARSDIWSFGCVLWECLTGERPFRGETISDLVASILHAEPDWTRLPVGTPPGIIRVLRRCLAKDPRQRFHHVADARIELEDASSGVSPAGPAAPASSRTRLVVGALSLGLIAVTAVLFLVLARGCAEPVAGPPVFENPLAGYQPVPLTKFPGAEFDAAISPDGRWFAFVSDRDGPFDVFVGQIDGGTYHKLTADKDRFVSQDVRARVRNVGFVGQGRAIWLGGGWTEKGMKQSESIVSGPFKSLVDDEAVNAAWTRDGRRMVYHHGTGGDPIWVADGSGLNKTKVLGSQEGFHQHYPAWSTDERWIYVVRGWETTGDVDLWRVRADGSGTKERLTEGKRKVAYPTPLDDRTVLYVAEEADGSGPWLWALDVETRVSIRATFGLERYSSVSASADGRRVVATIVDREARLWSVPIREGGAEESDAVLFPTKSVRAHRPRVRGDDLYYLSSRGAGDGLWRLGPDGEPVEIWPGRSGALLEPAAITADGERIAVTLRLNREIRLYVMNTDGSAPEKLTDEVVPHGAADWSPKGEWLVVGGTARGQRGLYKVSADGGEWTCLFPGEAVNPVWSPRGDLIVFAGKQVSAYTPLLAIRPDGKVVELPPIKLYRGGERYRFLPDGSALVYMLGETPGLNFHLLDLESLESRRLTSLDGALETRGFDITADGKRIIFDRLSENSDLVLFDRGAKR